MTKYDASFVLYGVLSTFLFLADKTEGILYLTGIQVVYFLSELANEKVKK